jgi:hypothetical protein
MALIQFFEHHESSGYASRLDVAVVTDGTITNIFTIYVENGNTVGSLNRPFVKGDTLDMMWQRLATLNELPDGAVCLCGSADEHHFRSAGCEETSRISEIIAETAIEYASKAKRSPVGTALSKIAQRAVKGKK